MNARGFPSPRFSNGTPRNYQQLPNNNRQPLYLQPNATYLSPRGSRAGSPRNSLGSPDFIPLGVSSPVGLSRIRQNWNQSQRNQSNNSSFSGCSTPPSSNSSPNYSPYNRRGSRGNFRDRRSFNSNHSGSSSSHISMYIDKGALEDPWAELEKQFKGHCASPEFIKIESEKSQGSTLPNGSGSEDDSSGSVNDDY